MNIQRSLLLAMVVVFGIGSAFAEETAQVQQRRQEIDKNAQATLDELLKTHDGVRDLYGRAAGYARLIGFDMGGTSTDVSHFAGAYERAFETEVAGVRMRAPMMLIHTVAAGGGSILHFDGARFRVGPDSAGASRGPISARLFTSRYRYSLPS